MKAFRPTFYERGHCSPALVGFFFIALNIIVDYQLTFETDGGSGLHSCIRFSSPFQVGEIRIDWRERYGGKTKYGTSRLIKGLRDLVYISLTTRLHRLPGASAIARLMIKVNYDKGKPTYEIRSIIPDDGVPDSSQGG